MLEATSARKVINTSCSSNLSVIRHLHAGIQEYLSGGPPTSPDFFCHQLILFYSLQRGSNCFQGGPTYSSTGGWGGGYLMLISIV